VLVILTEAAYERFWTSVARPGLRPVLVHPGGRLTDDTGATIDRERADGEVAWGTSDLYAEGAPFRPFFGLLRRAPGLHWFQSPAAGFDAPIYAELARRGVRITNAHVNSIPIAEYVMRAVLDHFQDAEAWRRAEADRRWSTHDFREVQGSTWLVVGVGSIGGHVARRARAFGATVIGCRRRPTADDPVDEAITPDQLPEAAGRADVIVVAAPATPETTGLLGDAFFAAVRPGGLLVNVARGSLVDETSLLAGLDRGAPGHAVLDVFSEEPLPSEHPFWTHPAVTVTPHNAAGGLGRYQRQAELFSENLDRYLSGQPLLNDVTDAAVVG